MTYRCEYCHKDVSVGTDDVGRPYCSICGRSTMLVRCPLKGAPRINLLHPREGITILPYAQTFSIDLPPTHGGWAHISVASSRSASSCYHINGVVGTGNTVFN